MLCYDGPPARCLVFTFKEGLLSKVAHDLMLRVRNFRIDLDPEGLAVSARFDACSVEAVCAMRDGKEAPGLLADKDLRDIEGRMAKDVLRPAQHPEIRFRSTSAEPADEGYLVQGVLSLRGRQRRIRFHARPEGDLLVAEARVDQPTFGIKPYSALLGALKVKPVVRVRFELPRP